MQHNVIFVGSQFRKNQIFYEYIKRELIKSLGNIDNIHFFNDQDKALFLRLESFIQESEKLVIVCSKSNFSVIGRLLCTISGDSQIVKEEMLIPSKTDVYAKNSYLLNIDKTNLNVLQAEATKVLPQILFEDPLPQAVLHVFDESEYDLKLLLAPLAESFDIVFEVNEWIDLWLVVEVTALKYGELTGFIHAASALFKGKVIASNNIMAYIIDKLQREKRKVTTAESCTGGLIASLITSQAGSSDVFDGGIVTYSNEKKNQWLGVDEKLLAEFGAVSKETVLAMSQGAKDVAEANYALSVSGIAGPGGGSAQKPVGLVYISICSKTLHKASVLKLEGDRNYIQYQAAYHAIKLLLLSDKELFFNLT